MLSVKDNMERALAAIADDLRADERLKGLVAGIEATGRELDSVFQRHGVTRVDAVGQPLDPNRHQAMLEVPSDAEPGTIVQEMQPGYMIKDRLLRPALVGVAKKPD
jgi:molecular chaperone GrpE